MSTDDGAQQQADAPSAEVDSPPAPTPRASELWINAPFALLEAGRYTIGWHNWAEGEGGLAFVTLRRGALGTSKIVNRYPMNDEGWDQAWRELSALDPATAERVRAVLTRRAEAEAAAAAAAEAQNADSAAPQVSARSSPEVRARILEMFKRSNSKYAKPFEKDRLAMLSVMGGNWEEYGQIILQMAILDTLLSIEELLRSANGADGSGEDD
jgi:hypothetical protein